MATTFTPYGSSSVTISPPAIPTAQSTVKDNLSTIPDLTKLTQQLNAINQGAQSAALESRIPGAAGLEAQSSTNIGANLRGELPTDVLNLLGQQAAERGVRGGYGAGSPNTNAAYLRALGLTSLNRQDVGQNELTAAYARNPAAPLVDPASMLMTPYQQGTLGVEQQNQNLRTAGFGQNLLDQFDLASQANRGAYNYGTVTNPASTIPERDMSWFYSPTTGTGSTSLIDPYDFYTEPGTFSGSSATYPSGAQIDTGAPTTGSSQFEQNYDPFGTGGMFDTLNPFADLSNFYGG